MHPDISSVFNMKEPSQELVRSMRDAKIEPRKIIQVMESLGEEGLTEAQIRKICTPRGHTLNTGSPCKIRKEMAPKLRINCVVYKFIA